MKDGWCWPALLFPPLWLVYRRMWLVLLGWLLVIAALSVAAVVLKPPAGIVPIVDALFAFWLALEANALRRWTLMRNGWRFRGLATGVDRVDAEQRFFAAGAGDIEGSVPAPPSRSAPRARAPEAVLGVFPEPYGSQR